MTTAPLHAARTERLALCETLLATGPDAPTLCSPWLTRDLAAHLVIRERRPDLAAGMFVPFLASRLDAGMKAYADKPWEELVDLVRTGPPVWSPTRVSKIDDAVNTVELLIHHEDVLRGDGQRGPRRELDDATQRRVWSLLRSPLIRALVRKSPVGMVLTAPGHGTVTLKASEPRVVVTGAPLELLLTAYGRQQVAVVDYQGDPSAVQQLKDAELGF